MVFPSSWISQSIQAQNSMFSGLQSFSQQASASGGLMNGGPPSPAAMGGVSPPPPPATLMGVMRGYGGYGGGPSAGAYGEAMAGRMASMGQTGMGLAGAGMAGLGVAGSLGLIGGPMGAMASMMDPMGLAMRAGMGGFSAAGGGFGGAAMGLGAAGAVALPLYAGAQYAGALASNFRGGMQDQMSLNSNLRQNFNFMGGQGAYGRGFSQQQMGQIGSSMSGMMRQDHMLGGQGELNELVSGGAAMGSFSGVRDVQSFTRRFREMITTLRTVQRELGGSLQEAQEFVNQSRQAGVFGSTAATRFASTIRNTSAVTGMDQGQLLQLASNGAQVSRAFGGLGRQGATGALRGVTSMATALNAGMIDESMLSEATGGLTGTEAMSSFVTNMMQRTGERSRSGHGRFGIFGLSNRDGTGLDEGAMMQFQMGDMGVGDLSRRAHGNVGHMGRARAINREGILRGAAIEEGGLGFQIGMHRQLLGNEGSGMSSDLMSQVLQRRGHMSRPESEVMASMIRNQGTIARSEIDDRISSRREEGTRTDVREHRSLDAFQREIGHSLSEGLGLNRAREIGRSFVTGVSSRIERAMNGLLGIVDEGMTGEVRGRMGRLASGAGSTRDMRMLEMATGGASIAPTMTGMDTFNRSMFQTGPTVGERMMASGFNVGGFGVGEAGRGMRAMGVRPGGNRVIGVRADGSRLYAGGASEMTARETEAALNRLTLAQAGHATGGRSAEILGEMSGENAGATRTSILNAMAAAEGHGDVNQFMTHVGARDRRGRSALTEDRGVAISAFMAREGMVNPNEMAAAEIMMAGTGEADMRTSAGRFVDTLGEHSVSAEDYFTGGGTAGAEMLDMAERLRTGPTRDRRLLTDAMIRGMSHDQRLAEAQELEGRAAMLAGVDPEAMTEVMARPDVRRASEMLLSDDADERQRGADLMGELTGAEEVGSGARGALNSLRENATLLVADGDEPDPNRRAAFMSVVLPREERAAMVRETARTRASFNSIAASFGEDSELGRMFRTAGTENSGAAMFGGLEAGSDRMAVMSDEDFQVQMREATTAMSGMTGAGAEENRDRLRSFMMNATAEHGRARDIMGRGRRGRRGGREASMDMMTGGAFADMEFSIGGRTVGARAATDMMLDGGRHSAEITDQLREQLTRAGLDDAAINDITGTLTSVYSTGEGARRGENGEEVSVEEMGELDAMRDRHAEGFDRIARERHEAALGAAQSRDPVGAETNRLLGEISSGISRIAPADTTSPPPVATDQNMSGGTCASPDTLIATPEGERPISELRVGDRVLSMDHGVMCAVPLQAVQRIPVTKHHVLRITLDNGRIVEMSGGHPTAEGLPFQQLTPGMRLGDATIMVIEQVPYMFEATYDILPVSDTGTYIAAGALVGTTMHRGEGRWHGQKQFSATSSTAAR